MASSSSQRFPIGGGGSIHTAAERLQHCRPEWRCSGHVIPKSPLAPAADGIGGRSRHQRVSSSVARARGSQAASRAQVSDLVTAPGPVRRRCAALRLAACNWSNETRDRAHGRPNGTIVRDKHSTEPPHCATAMHPGGAPKLGGEPPPPPANGKPARARAGSRTARMVSGKTRAAAGGVLARQLARDARGPPPPPHRPP